VYCPIHIQIHTIYSGDPAQCFCAFHQSPEQQLFWEYLDSMEQIFLSLGSNLGDRLGNLRRALDSLREFSAILALSDAYETEPVDYTEQPWFVNAVVALDVGEARDHANADDPNADHANDGHANDEASAPHRLLERLLSIERVMGRRRGVADAIPKGPRIIDLDILLYGSRVIHSPSLTVPHPAMHLRRFVLEPLAQIAPQFEHPVLRLSALQLLAALPDNGPLVRRLGPLDWPEG
jgi:2-amino-4-hydroxy-6-hydroxymethyldihydropteridine diphosphokinase